MIRVANKDDLPALVSIWYEASVEAHDFIPASFWQSQKTNMQEVYLPGADTWVYYQDGRLAGFICHHQGFIPALFVDKAYQSQGIGQQLLTFLKTQYPVLSLAVYAKNSAAHRFYQRHGFVETQRKGCEHSGEEEVHMHWHQA
ncbi:N-acetyltransferase [Bowmanella yangjiangensis]|uniref:N-acetyltransferase n=1 Tax=Bowmanella yangjiangensis TaxID=2811230 RepID=A0ABS3CRM0_9ALTE|nr:N-acetyltransferase [Bowmanella yangjiangensis]MBN7818304.1 N-acetyltransferase [Bowmanella yangjiangensis]